MRPLGNAAKLEERRRRAVESVESGELSATEAAAKAKVTIRTMRRWLAEYRAKGTGGLAARKQSGRPPKLSQVQMRRLMAMLVKGAEHCGFATPLWTCRRVAELIKREFGVKYNSNYVARLLGRLGWSPQKPIRRAVERDETAIDRWVKVDWRRIKKRPQKSGPQ